MFFELTSHLRIPTRIPWRWLFLIGILIIPFNWCISFSWNIHVDLVERKGWKPQSSLITNHESQVRLQLWKHVLLLRELFLHVPGQNNGETEKRCHPAAHTNEWDFYESVKRPTTNGWRLWRLYEEEVASLRIVWIIAKCLNFWTFYVHTSHSRAHTLRQNIQPIITSPKEHASPIFQHATGLVTGLCSFRVSSLNASACTSCLGWSISMHPSRYISAMAAKELPSLSSWDAFWQADFPHEAIKITKHNIQKNMVHWKPIAHRSLSNC